MAKDFSQILETALKRFDAAYAPVSVIRMQAVESRRFVDVAGAMWEGGDEEDFANSPRYEINKISRSVERIFNEYRANRITVDFRPKSESADDDVADLLDGMFRSDEKDSNAQEAYDNAFQDAVKGGIGAFRLATEYDDETDEYSTFQKISFLPIYDADANVIYDPDARRYDKADAKYCFVLTGLSPDAFKDKYPDAPKSTWDNPLNVSFDWYTADLIYVAEYYLREEKSYTVYFYSNEFSGDEQRISERELDKDELQAEIGKLEQMGYTLERKKKVKRFKVRKYILSGNEVLEDCGYIAGEHIPVVMVYGYRSIVQGVEIAQGQVQRGKDSQRIYNQQVSKLVGTAVFSQDSKPVMHPEEIAGLELLWANDNRAKNPYLLRNPLTSADGQPVYNSPIQYTQPRVIPQATAALLDIANRDIQDVTGNLDRAMEAQPNMSGVALQSVQQRLDMGAFGFMDNMAQSIRRAGEIWLSMRRDIETEYRTVDTLEEDGSQGKAEIYLPVINENSEEVLKNDIAKGSYKVVVDVAPSFTTRRDATLQKITGMMQMTQDPSMQAVLFNVALQNLDGEGIADVRQYARKQLVQMGVVEPNETEAQEMQQAAQNQQPDANTQYLQAAAQKEAQLAEKANADTAKALADTEYTQAKTLEVLNSIDTSKLNMLMQIAEKLTPNQTQEVQ